MNSRVELLLLRFPRDRGDEWQGSLDSRQAQNFPCPVERVIDIAKDVVLTYLVEQGRLCKCIQWLGVDI